MNEEYNGWTNYQTWRANLEILDGMEWTVSDSDDHDEKVASVASQMEDFMEEALTEGVESQFVVGLVHEFIRRVNFDEIAEHYVNDLVQTEGEVGWVEADAV